MADLKAGRDALLPAEVSAAMLKGATLLRAVRKWRGMTQVQVADLTGLGQGYLSEIETGAKKGSRDALEVLAAALNVPADWLTDQD